MNKGSIHLYADNIFLKQKRHLLIGNMKFGSQTFSEAGHAPAYFVRRSF